MALLFYTLIVVWFHEEGRKFVLFPYRPWYRHKREASFADMLTTLRRLSYEHNTDGLLPNRGRIKTYFTQLTELLSRAG